MNIFEYVEKANKELTCDDLTDDVEVEHVDGSMFKLKNAVVQNYDNFTIVFSEHHRPLFWFHDEVKVTVLK